MDRDEFRMKLWCDVYVAAVHEADKVWPDCANKAVENFDEAFPEPTPGPSPPPPPSSKMMTTG